MLEFSYKSKMAICQLLKAENCRNFFWWVFTSSGARKPKKCPKINFVIPVFVCEMESYSLKEKSDIFLSGRTNPRQNYPTLATSDHPTKKGFLA